MKSSLQCFGVFSACVLAPLALGCASSSESSREEDTREDVPSKLSLDLNAEEGDIDFGVADMGNGMNMIPSRTLVGRRGVLSPSEVERLRTSKDSMLTAGTPKTEEPAPDWKQQLRDSVVDEKADGTVRIALELKDQKFPWFEFRNKGLSEDDRAALVEARQQQLGPSLDALEKKLVAVGAQDIHRAWIVPVAFARVPVSRVDEISRWEEVEHGMRDDNQTGESLVSYRPGVEGRAGVRTNAFVAAGYTGSAGHDYTSSKVRLGAFDPGSELAYNHVGFKTSAGGARIIKKTNCDYGSCVAYTPTQVNSHPTAVFGIAGGSIEAGQDASYTTSTDRLQRSGLASGPNLYFYTGVEDPWSTATAIAMMEQSTIDGLDVMNHSYNWGNCSPCVRTCDKTGFNAALANSTNAGTLHVIAAGNDGDLGTDCRVRYPGTRRDGLTVGGLQSTDTATAYDTMGIYTESSYGGMDIKINGTVYSGVASLVDLVAPACYSNLYTWTSGASSYGNGAYGSGCGTSYATPTVAGAVAQTLHSFYSLGWSGMDARMVQAYMLTMTDGWNAITNTTDKTGFSDLSGAGRLKSHFMAGSNLTNPWAWGCHKATISSGQTVAYSVYDSNPESASIKTWKAALTWEEDDLDNAADLDLAVYNVCPSVGTEALVASDDSRDLRARIRLLSSDIGGKCLEYRVKGYYIPPGQTRTFTACDYFQSGNVTDH